MTPSRSRLAALAIVIPALMLGACDSLSIIGRLDELLDGGLAATGGARATGGTGGGGAGGSPVVVNETPCAALARTGTPCVAAHSTTRVIYPGYVGPLYRVCKGTPAAGPSSCASGQEKDIASVNGYADAATQDAFCGGAACSISVIYDQTPNGNHLMPAPMGGNKNTADNPASANDLATTIGGHPVYGLQIRPGIGYRAGCTGCGVPVAKGTATGDQPETIYMVTSQNGLVNGCCFDYGNAETSSNDDGNGTVEAVNFSNGVAWGTGAETERSKGPWVMADLENGLFAGWQNGQDQGISTNVALHHAFVTAVLVGDSCGNVNCSASSSTSPLGRFALYGADATTGGLQTMYDGSRPTKAGYVPMRKQGSIVLGTAGDNSAADSGQFFEGAMASGAATAAALQALQASIVAAGYGK